jgi:hypothetical protein
VFILGMRVWLLSYSSVVSARHSLVSEGGIWYSVQTIDSLVPVKPRNGETAIAMLGCPITMRECTFLHIHDGEVQIFNEYIAFNYPF